MAILTAKYTTAQSGTDSLNTTPANLNDAMGIIGGDPVNRLKNIGDYFAANNINFTLNVTPTQAIASIKSGQQPDVFSGSFSTTFTTSSLNTAFSAISGTITGWTAGGSGANNDRYSVVGINIDASTYFNSATWANILSGGDTLIGGAGNDVLQDYGTKNTFQGLGGNDTFIAAAGGSSTAIFRGKMADYSVLTSTKIAHDGLTGLSGYTVNDAVANRDGFTQMINISRLSFSDTKLALDTGATQSAGQTALLLGAVLPNQLALDPTKQALVGAVIGLFDAGYNLQTLAGALMRLPIWDVLTNKANPINTDIANYLLNNVNGAVPSSTTLINAALQLAGETGATQGTFLANLAASSAGQTHIGLVGLQTRGLAYV